MPKLSTQEWVSLNGKVIPELADWYRRHGTLLSKKGQKVVDRALSKGTFAGPTGSRRLLEPAILLESRVSIDDLYELATICRTVPFTGDYGAWEPIRATYATVYRALSKVDDPRASSIEELLSFPENGERTGPPVSGGAMTNRLNGILIDTFDYTFTSPLTIQELSYLIEKLRELMVLWAFGGSSTWPRERICAAIAECQKLLEEHWATSGTSPISQSTSRSASPAANATFAPRTDS